MPKFIGVKHDSYLKKFISSGAINILKSDNRFLLTKDLNGFIHPILARIKLNPSYNFGASALITPVQNGC